MDFIGFNVNGYFVSKESKTFECDDGSKKLSECVLVSIGMNVYRVYLAEGEFAKLEVLKIGDPIVLTVRPYVSKTGKLCLSDGHIDL